MGQDASRDHEFSVVVLLTGRCSAGSVLPMGDGF